MYSEIIENCKIKDVNGEELIITPKTKVFDTGNNMNILCNYNDCIDSLEGFNMIIGNILSGRLIKAK